MGRKALLVQSHVVHGYVGNKAATFPLQYSGWDVDALNTVQFSNHPGYGHFSGFTSNSEELESIVEGGLVGALDMRYDVILTGYLPSAKMLRVLLGKTVSEMVIRSQHWTKWIVDPVLGDNGKLYVEEAAVQATIEILQGSQHKIYLVTPNQFEMELLTGVKISDHTSLVASFERFTELYPNVERIVVTSINLEGEMKHDLLVVASLDSQQEEREQSSTPFIYTVPRIPAIFSGSGDLLTALLTNLLVDDRDRDRDADASATNTEITLQEAVRKALWLIHSVLQRTYDIYMRDTRPLTGNWPTAGRENGPATEALPRINDLNVVQCLDLFRLAAGDIPSAL